MDTRKAIPAVGTGICMVKAMGAAVTDICMAKEWVMVVPVWARDADMAGDSSKDVCPCRISGISEIMK